MTFPPHGSFGYHILTLSCLEKGYDYGDVYAFLSWWNDKLITVQKKKLHFVFDYSGKDGVNT